MLENRVKRVQEVLAKRQHYPGILLENVFDPHNVSAVMRTCDSVGIMQIHTLQTQSPPHHLGGFRSSAGSWKWIKLIEHTERESCIRNLKNQYGKMIAAHFSVNAVSYLDFDFTQPHVLVFGNEQKGCSDTILEQCDEYINIPQVGMANSLNISVACAVILYEAFRQKLAVGHYQTPQLSEEERFQLYSEWTDPLKTRELKMRKA